MFGFDKMFDFNRDGKLDSWERAAQFQFMDEMMKKISLMKTMRSILLQMPDLIMMSYITLMSDTATEDRQFVSDICFELQEINEILQCAQAHVGYRVRDEIIFYMLNNKKAELLDTNLAFDNEIMQKILPRIQGSSASIKDMLCELFKKCAGDYTGLSQASVSEQMQVYVETKDCKYKKSAEKICYMMRRFEEDGFTSYWL